MALKVGIVGCTGAVGVEILTCMRDCELGIDPEALVLFASERSAGKQQWTPWGDRTIRAFNVTEARKMDVLFLAVSGDSAKAVSPSRLLFQQVYARELTCLVSPSCLTERARARGTGRPDCHR